MLERRTDTLSALLDDSFTLTHMTGRVQTKAEWLTAIDASQMRYHAEQERSVTIEVTGDKAVLVGRNVVTATIYGSRGTWSLQLSTDYVRREGTWVATRMVASTF